MSSFEVKLGKRQKGRLVWVRFMRLWPWFLWILLAVFTLLGVQYQKAAFSTVGLVTFEKRGLALAEAVKIGEIQVRVGDRVTRGQTLVEASQNHSVFDFSKLKQEQALDLADNNRRYLEIEQRIGAELRNLELDMKEDESELAVIESEYEKLANLSNTGLADPIQMFEFKVRIARLESRIETMAEQRASLHHDLLQVETLKAHYEHQLGRENPALEDDLSADANSIRLVADVPGVVSRIYKYEGDVALEGERILEWIVDSPPLVQGFLPLGSSTDLSVGQRVFLKTNNGTFEGDVLSIGSVAESIEDQSNPIIRRRMKGRVFAIQPLSEIDCVDGEQIDILFDQSESDGLFAWLSKLVVG